MPKHKGHKENRYTAVRGGPATSRHELIQNLAIEAVKQRAVENRAFWVDEATWPKDTSDYVFLARAVHLMGGTLFPGEWTRKEPEEWATAKNPLGKIHENAPTAPAKRMSSVVQTIAANAALGHLIFASRPAEMLAFTPLPWGDKPNHSRFLNCKLGRLDRAENRQSGLDLRNLVVEFGKTLDRARGVRHSNVRNWLFITRESLGGF